MPPSPPFPLIILGEGRPRPGRGPEHRPSDSVRRLSGPRTTAGDVPGGGRGCAAPSAFRSHLGQESVADRRLTGEWESCYKSGTDSVWLFVSESSVGPEGPTPLLLPFLTSRRSPTAMGWSPQHIQLSISLRVRRRQLPSQRTPEGAANTPYVAGYVTSDFGIPFPQRR